MRWQRLTKHGISLLVSRLSDANSDLCALMCFHMSVPLLVSYLLIRSFWCGCAKLWILNFYMIFRWAHESTCIKFQLRQIGCMRQFSYHCYNVWGVVFLLSVRRQLPTYAGDTYVHVFISLNSLTPQNSARSFSSVHRQVWAVNPKKTFCNCVFVCRIDTSDYTRWSSGELEGFISSKPSYSWGSTLCYGLVITQ